MCYCYLLPLLFCSIKAGQSPSLWCYCVKQPDLTLKVVLLWEGGWTRWPPEIPSNLFFLYGFFSPSRNSIIWHPDTLIRTSLCPPTLTSQQKTNSLFLSQTSALSLCRLESRWCRHMAIRATQTSEIAQYPLPSTFTDSKMQAGLCLFLTKSSVIRLLQRYLHTPESASVLCWTET